MQNRLHLDKTRKNPTKTPKLHNYSNVLYFLQISRKKFYVCKLATVNYELSAMSIVTA
jgi:hypothetical protein